MSESILKALMQLFAIIAHVDETGISTNARKIVKAYLDQHLSQEIVTEFLVLFDAYIEFHHRDITKSDGTKMRKRTSANSVKVLMICRQINEELEQKQKVLVLLQLFEFINENKEITEKELDFVHTVSDIFNISEAEYQDMKAFVIDGIEKVTDSNKLLIINEQTQHPTLKHIHNQGISGEIVVLSIESTAMYVFNYSGQDDVYLNGHNILPYRTYVLDHGASVRGPKIKPVYYGDVVSKFMESNRTSKIVFCAKDIEFCFKNSENGLHKFNFYEESGHMVGIMGGSGVGKSTLLNVLNGNLEPQKGQITINGYDIYTQKEHLDGVIGFVPQDDLLIEELTVYQNLYYNAKLCFKDLSELDINLVIEDILYDLDLYEIRSLIVGGTLNKFISGGQRKRLNIALELMREPSVLFVDEPTSGLSSMDSDMVMDLLKEQSLKGKLVIVNIHQPSSDIYKLFDKLLILDKGGYPIYIGDPLDAVIYFKKMSRHANSEESECVRCGNVNPEQVLQIVEAKIVNEYGKLTRSRKVSPKEWYSLYQTQLESKFVAPPTQQIPLPENKFKIPSQLEQLKIFSIRNILSKLADHQFMLINFLEAPLLALILGLLTKFIIGTEENPSAYIFSDNENIPAYLFMCVVVSLFMGLSVSAEEIIKDRKILKRESFLNLSKISYLNSKIVVLLVISAIQTLSFLLVGNTILGVKGMTLSYWLVLFSTAACANMIGLNISAALNSVVTIYILIPFILVPQLLLSGVIVKFDKLYKPLSSDLYVPVVGDLMTSRWAYEALAVEQFKNNAYQRHFFKIEQNLSETGFRLNYIIPELETKIDKCVENKGDKEKTKIYQKDINILANEFERLSKYEKNNFQFDFTPTKFDSNIARNAHTYLRGLKEVLQQKQEKWNKKKDHLYRSLIKKMGNKDAIVELQKNYYNTNLAELVQNKQELRKIVELNGTLIQKMDPIYCYPESNWGRAHFYAPAKKFFGIYFDTYWVNIGVIWLMSSFLYITLCKNSLRKFIDWLSKWQLKIPNLKKRLPKS